MSLQEKTVLGIGVATMDCLCLLKNFPHPDEKVRADAFHFEGGGNAANTIVALARLGLQTKLLSRIGKDALGVQCLAQLQKEGVDVSCLQVDDIATPFSMILIDSSHHTRTVIHCAKPSTLHYGTVNKLNF